jgi:endonuclease/exonuclease/phosphatase family metal-dependent hydrolase
MAARGSAPACDHESVAGRSVQWAVAGGLAGWAAARLAGADRLRRSEAWGVPALSFTPQVAAAAWACALLFRGRGPAATAAMAGAALTVAVSPRALPRRQPAADGPLLRVVTANLLAGRADAGEVTDLVRSTRADVLFVQELTSDSDRRLSEAGLGDLLPHREIRPTRKGPRGNGIYARYPLSAGLPVPTVYSAELTARLDLPAGQSAQLVCVHTRSPKPVRRRNAAARWRRDLAGLPRPAETPVILAGDFNATLDHVQFRRLLRLGYADAASQAGNGLALTWGPRPGAASALLAIDHILVDSRCAVRATSVHRLSGTDHRAVYAELQLPRP